MGPDRSQNHLTLPVMDRINAAWTGRPPRREGGLVRALRRLVPHPLQHVAGQAAPVWLRDQIVDRTYTSGHDWARTPGFAIRACQPAYVRLNLRGRERLGLLEPDGPEHGRYVEHVRTSFLSLRDPAGRPLVEEVLDVGRRFPARAPTCSPTWSWPGATRPTPPASSRTPWATSRPATTRGAWATTPPRGSAWPWAPPPPTGPECIQDLTRAVLAAFELTGPVRDERAVLA